MFTMLCGVSRHGAMVIAYRLRATIRKLLGLPAPPEESTQSLTPAWQSLLNDDYENDGQTFV
jgi:hypothetical protein